MREIDGSPRADQEGNPEHPLNQSVAVLGEIEDWDHLPAPEEIAPDPDRIDTDLPFTPCAVSVIRDPGHGATVNLRARSMREGEIHARVSVDHQGNAVCWSDVGPGDVAVAGELDDGERHRAMSG